MLLTNNVRATVKIISIRVDMHHLSGYPTTQIQPARANNLQELKLVKYGLRIVKKYKAIVCYTISVHLICKLMH